MDHNERMQFDGCLNRMFILFAKIARVSKDGKEITEYIEAHDRAKKLLSNAAMYDPDRIME